MKMGLDIIGGWDDMGSIGGGGSRSSQTPSLSPPQHSRFVEIATLVIKENLLRIRKNGKKVNPHEEAKKLLDEIAAKDGVMRVSATKEKEATSLIALSLLEAQERSGVFAAKTEAALEKASQERAEELAKEIEKMMATGSMSRGRQSGGGHGW